MFKVTYITYYVLAENKQDVHAMILPRLLRLVQCGTFPQLPESSKGKAVTTTACRKIG